MSKYILPAHHLIFSVEDPLHKPKVSKLPTTEEAVQYLNDMGENAQIIHGHYQTPQKSIMVSHPKNIKGILNLAANLGQESVIHSKNGQHELRYLSGEHTGKSVVGSGTSFFKEKPDDFYSTIQTKDGPIHFSHNLDFNALKDSSKIDKSDDLDEKVKEVADVLKGHTHFVEDPWTERKESESHLHDHEIDNHVDDPKEHLENFEDDEVKKAVSDSKKTDKKIADEVMDGQWVDPVISDRSHSFEVHLPENNHESTFKSLTPIKLFRAYKNTPHRPEALFLKYAIHRIENRDKYKNASKDERYKLDQEFLDHHQQGKAQYKNGHITPSDLQNFIHHKGHKIVQNLLEHQRKLHNLINTDSPHSVSVINGRPRVALTRALKTSEHGPDHALASYADVRKPPFGGYEFHYKVPLDNIWYSYAAGPKTASSAKYGHEDEFLVSPHDRVPAESFEVHGLVDTKRHTTKPAGIPFYGEGYESVAPKEMHNSIMNKVKEFPDSRSAADFALNRNLSSEHQRFLLDDRYSSRTLHKMAMNPTLTYDNMRYVVNSNNPGLKNALTENPALHDDFKNQLVNDKDDDVRESIARREDLSPEQYHKLSTDSDEYVLRSLALNSSTPIHILNKLKNIKKEGISEFAENTLKQLNKKPQKLAASEKEENIESCQDLFTPIFNEQCRLDKDVRNMLLAIYSDILEDLRNKGYELHPEFVVITGSLLGPNWDSQSDLDFHIGIDFDKDDYGQSFPDYLSMYCRSFNENKFQIKGRDLELYFQNVNEPHYSPGIYDVMNDHWIRPPNHEKIIISDEERKTAQEYLDKILHLDSLNLNPGEKLTESQRLFNSIKQLRKKSLLEEHSEAAFGNQVFKLLRRNGGLQKLSDMIKDSKYNLYLVKGQEDLNKSPIVDDEYRSVSIGADKEGDLDKKGYDIQHWVDKDGFHNVTATKDGQTVGYASFTYDYIPNELGTGLVPGDLKGWDLYVHPDHRRKGLASAMYNLAEQKSGKKIIQGGVTPDGHKFWSNPKRSFGKDENKGISLNVEPEKDIPNDDFEKLQKPYVSEAQRRWAHTPAGIRALGGKKNVAHWDKETKGKKIPEKVSKTEGFEQLGKNFIPQSLEDLKYLEEENNDDIIDVDFPEEKLLYHCVNNMD